MFRPPRIRSLAHRHAIRIGLVGISALTLSGAVEMAFSYQEALSQTRELQAAEATAAAREIEQHLRVLTSTLRGVTQQVVGGQTQPDDLLYEFSRVMGLFQLISEVRIQAADGAVLLTASRTGPNFAATTGWGRPPPDVQAHKPAAAEYGQPYFADGQAPFVKISFPGALPGGASTVVTLNLRLISDVVRRLDAGSQGRAFLIDARNFLIVHPDQTEILRMRDLSAWEPVSAARRLLVHGRTTASIEGRSFDRPEHMIATATFVAGPGWLLFLEQPRATALEPVFATLRRTALLVLLAVAMTAAASAWSGRRMAQPLLALRAASGRIASGDFTTPVVLSTGDELELLAHDLNDMAHRLSHFYEELESQVVLRTRQLTQARDLAERANQAKTRFLASASHDLRQPMHTIGLLTGVLASRAEDPAQLQLVRKLLNCVGTMERLFTSLLDISKLDAGAVQAQHRPFPIQDLLDRMSARFELIAAERGLKLRVRACRAIVVSDPALLERCLGNLLSNALAYTRRGRVLLGCRPRGDQLLIQVHDTGPGIAEDQLGRIFEEFVRLPAGDPHQSDGLGLGLAIVKRTAQLLGHPLQVRSTAGRGSTFELSVARPLHGSLPDPPLESHPSHPLDLKGTFVLVVDDDEGNRMALHALCSSHGCQVAQAQDVESALTEIQRHLRPPDIVLADHRLGPANSEDGLTLVSRVRHLTEDATPFILMTADTSPAIAHGARQLGVPVVYKPASAARILNCMAELLAPAPVLPEQHEVEEPPPLSGQAPA